MSYTDHVTMKIVHTVFNNPKVCKTLSHRAMLNLIFSLKICLLGMLKEHYGLHTFNINCVILIKLILDFSSFSLKKIQNLGYGEALRMEVNGGQSRNVFLLLKQYFNKA